VDYVAPAIVYLSLHSENIGKIFHLVNPNGNTLWSEVINVILKLKGLRHVSFAEWYLMVTEEAKRHPSFGAILPFLGSEDFASGRPYECQKTLLDLKESGIECLPIKEQLIQKIIQYLSQSK
jgi:hypothetical protein